MSLWNQPLFSDLQQLCIYHCAAGNGTIIVINLASASVSSGISALDLPGGLAFGALDIPVSHIEWVVLDTCPGVTGAGWLGVVVCPKACTCNRMRSINIYYWRMKSYHPTISEFYCEPNPSVLIFRVCSWCFIYRSYQCRRKLSHTHRHSTFPSARAANRRSAA
jgi:hypothetical protein